MGALNGFGNQKISPALITDIALSSHGTRTMMSEGIMFNAIAGGTVYNDQQEVVDVDEVQSRCPLSIYNLGSKTNEEGTQTYKINVWPGMINNLIPNSDDGEALTKNPPPDIQVFANGLTSETTINYIYIRCGNESSGAGAPVYPVRNKNDPMKYPTVKVETEEKTDTDEYSYILIGIVSGKKELIPESDPPAYTETLTINQMIGCNSLWTERFKCGSGQATYWWSAV